jgi:hypothetical protein
VNIELDCPSCSGRLSFSARRRGHSGRLVGTCGDCASVYTLYGGRVSPIDATLPRRPAAPTWSFGSLVARERRAALELASPPAAVAD